MANSIPVYIFSGFLDSGKTKTIKETLYDIRFNEGEFTLIIALEQGDLEYDDKFLRLTNCEVVYLDSLKELTKEKMKELDTKYKPERVVIELNGMEDDRELYNQGFIRKWEIAQTLTCVDASTFSLYVNNMKQFIFNHVYNAEVVVLNRVDGIDKKFIRNNLKAINPKVEIIYEDNAGNVTNKLDEDMFDVSKPINLSLGDYGLWYMDAVDHPAKYDGCKLSVDLRYIEKHEEYDTVALMGRPAMVCCANDITDISMTIVDVDTKKMKLGSFYHISGVIHVLDDEEGYKTCVLYANEYTEIEAPEDDMVYFS